MCAIGEETGPSARNPAANKSLVGIVATNSLVSRAGIIPASLTRDRAGVLCRSVKDAATVLTVLAGYDPTDPATAESLDQSRQSRMTTSSTTRRSTACASAWCASSCSRTPRRTRKRSRSPNDAIADLAKAGATIVDPGPDGELFRRRLPRSCRRSTRHAAAVYKELFSAGTNTPFVDRWFSCRATPSTARRIDHPAARRARAPTSGEVLYAMDRYLRDRGDKNIVGARSLRAIDLLRSRADRRRDPGSPGTARRSARTVRFTQERQHADDPKLPVATVDISRGTRCARRCRCW